MAHNSLNSEQKRAVLTTEGPVLILAGAGAGKTKTITERIRHLVLSGVAPSKILAITFTNKAAKEMRERVERRLAEDPDLNRPISMHERPFVSTFHSLGVHILREQAVNAGLKRHFTIFDRDDSKKVVKDALVSLGLDPKTHDPNAVLSIISKLKGRGLNASDWNNLDEGGYFMDVVGQVWPIYEKVLEKENALDFDDLLLKTSNLLRENESVRNHYRNTWRYIHIDEYQDTNRVQYEISQMLVGPEKNLCVVGDIDQNIYSWRGADIKNILAFESDYPEAQVITLEENYRSTKTILEAANAVIEKNKIRRKKNLFTSNDDGEKISLCPNMDEVGEANFIAEKAKTLIDGGVPADEMAVLYRANFQSRVLEEAFMTLGVPYQILGTRFFERKEIKDLISYLRVALNPECLSDLKRVINTPARGIGKTSVVKIFSGGEESLPPAMKAKLNKFRSLLSKIVETSKENKVSDTILFIIKESGLEDEWKEGGEDGAARLENAYELVNFAARYDHLIGEEAVSSFLTDAALQSDQDEMKEEQKAVRLMTVHSAKGLEFDVVFVAGLEDGLFPHQRINESNISPEEAEEERRLFYVAITRARKKIFLTYAQVRTVFGRQQVNMPSEFIFDIPENLTEEEAGEEGWQKRKPLLEIDF
ncbi:MAG: UvrD-helicase domain-containing protein [Candidatus Zambryskibacteria bacterium]|nr:UvrD-helicase domain-containing protein [Candidatus Zambryskibacteria bacterium]